MMYRFDAYCGEFTARLSGKPRKQATPKKSAAESLSEGEARNKRIPKKEFMAMILDAIRKPRKGEWIRNDQICKAVGVAYIKGMRWHTSPARRRLNRYLIEMRDSGLVESGGDGRWRLVVGASRS